ncbi:RNA polymerase factor sigma-54 [Nitrogeniibacter mangrovi]|uniref:RNA polymerase sigma-54 factor n=1 Tax=Nitrogeniibacter mangrovi TaxID=2016596 RepID=A0A6C1B0S9_9RHOO|nr:RNA polymerase factor sigma-54 [Nitrogeniibacter mangrovi]QID16505.1 RNA polymerase factor sigma-54 [Nitrogeniibacter mangrovi]
MKPTLQLKLSQHLTLTPQLQQSIKLLQLSTIELNQEIEKALLDNPLLEREDDGGPGEQDSATDTASNESEGGSEALEAMSEWASVGSGSTTNRDDDEDSDFQSFHAAQVSLREHLDQQIALTPMSDRDRTLVRILIEALDDDGYLTQSLEDMLELFDAENEVELEDLQIALHHLQHLDPPGVGARNPSECLALQLRALPQGDTRDLAMRIVTEHLELLAQRDFVRLRRNLQCTEDALRDAHHLICSLSPRPCAPFALNDTRYVIPDVVVRKLRGRWTAMLNPEAMPRLKVNALYAQLLQQNRGNNGDLGGQLQEAKWLIKNVQQRFDTILRVAQAIVDQQRQFFDYGEVAMRPLTLREIAEELELHESTISRVTTQKYMSTPRGVLEFKYFFGSHVATDTGGAASSTAIRALIRQLVDAEDRKKPLSDSKIADLLGQQGMVVARRTVAKYRESLNIPPVSKRKTI